MRHARAQALDELEPFLVRLRAVPGLVEKARGVFYVRSKAFLHFHEDPSGLHADVRLGSEFSRVRVETAEEPQRAPGAHPGGAGAGTSMSTTRITSPGRRSLRRAGC